MNYQHELTRKRAFEILKNSGEFSVQELSIIISTSEVLRDRFAMAALSSFARAGDNTNRSAEYAYAFADDMMIARNGNVFNQ